MKKKINPDRSLMMPQKLNSNAIPVIESQVHIQNNNKKCSAKILDESNNVFVTPESYNNRLGIAKAINEGFNDDHELAIIEMGTYSNGEIREICSKLGHMYPLQPELLQFIWRE